MSAPDARLVAVTVLEEISGFVAEYVTVKPDAETVRKDAKSALSAALKSEGDIECAVLSGKPGLVIPDHAKEIGAGLIVVGAHRPEVEDYALGPTAARLVRRAPCSIIVVR